MGLLTLEEFRAEVKTNLGNREDIPVERLDRFVNLAQTRISRAHDFEEMRRIGRHTLTVTGVPLTDRSLKLGRNVREVYAVILENGQSSRRLEGVTQGRWDLVVPATQELSPGPPSHYLLWNDTMEFWPVPDKTYTLVLRWSNWPRKIVSLAEVTELEVNVSDLLEKDDMILALATHNAFVSLGKKEDAGFWFTIYKDMMTDAKKEDKRRPDVFIKDMPDPGSGIGVSNTPWADPFIRETR